MGQQVVHGSFGSQFLFSQVFHQLDIYSKGLDDSLLFHQPVTLFESISSFVKTFNMKTIILFLIYLLTFMLFFFVLSLIGILWAPYSQIIHDGAWFIAYTLFIGCWIGIFPAREYYLRNEAHFNLVFG